MSFMSQKLFAVDSGFSDTQKMDPGWFEKVVDLSERGITVQDLYFSHHANVGGDSWMGKDGGWW